MQENKNVGQPTKAVTIDYEKEYYRLREKEFESDILKEILVEKDKEVYAIRKSMECDRNARTNAEDIAIELRETIEDLRDENASLKQQLEEKPKSEKHYLTWEEVKSRKNIRLDGVVYDYEIEGTYGNDYISARKNNLVSSLFYDKDFFYSLHLEVEDE